MKSLSNCENRFYFLLKHKILKLNDVDSKNNAENSTYHFSHFIMKFQIIKLQGKSCKDLIIFEFKFLKILDLLEKLMFANFI